MCRACGSSPVVGSSSSNSSGELISARAIVSRRFMPPDSGSTRASRRSRELHELQQLAGALADDRQRQAEVAAVDDEVVPDRQLGVEVVLLRHDAEPGPDLRTRAGARRSPKTVSAPSDGGETQPIIRIVEDLPAPLGPRKPNASPSADVEVDAVDGDPVVEALGQPARFDQVCHSADISDVRRLLAPNYRPENLALPGPFSMKLCMPSRPVLGGEQRRELLPLDLQPGLEVDRQARVDRLLGRPQRVRRAFGELRRPGASGVVDLARPAPPRRPARCAAPPRRRRTGR